MDSKVVKIGAARPRARTYYERFMEKEGVPVVDGYGVSDVRNLQLKPWKRLGCQGAYLQLRGLEGITSSSCLTATFPSTTVTTAKRAISSRATSAIWRATTANGFGKPILFPTRARRCSMLKSKRAPA